MPAADAPVSPEDRHHLIDALRGFALAGVLLANLGYLSLYNLLTEPARAALPTAGFDAMAIGVIEWLVSAKAITVFSLLFGLGFAIQIEAALSFLGLGAQPPTPSLGVMLSEGRDYLTQAPWVEIFPGIAIAFTVLALTLMGDGLGRRLDPRGMAR